MGFAFSFAFRIGVGMDWLVRLVVWIDSRLGLCLNTWLLWVIGAMGLRCKLLWGGCCFVLGWLVGDRLICSLYWDGLLDVVVFLGGVIPFIIYICRSYIHLDVK